MNEQPRILIIDDTLINIFALKGMLQETYKISAATSGTDGLKIATEQKPDLILLDITMPQMDGYQVLSALKSNAITEDIPVIVISGLDYEKDKQKAFALGAVDYIQKPFMADVIKETLSKHCHQDAVSHAPTSHPLIGLPNMEAIENDLWTVWEQSSEDKEVLAVLVIDIDDLGVINQTLGHVYGDAALAHLSICIGTAIKRKTDCVGRWGGKEYVALLPKTDTAQAIRLSYDIHSSLLAQADRSKELGLRDPLTVSIGVFAGIPSRTDALHTYISKANMAMLKAKASGKNRTCTFE